MGCLRKADSTTTSEKSPCENTKHEYSLGKIIGVLVPTNSLGYTYLVLPNGMVPTYEPIK